MNCSTQIATCSAHRADIPERPARHRGCVWYSGGVSFEEEDLVDRIAIGGTGKQDEEDEKTGSCYENQGCKCK